MQMEIFLAFHTVTAEMLRTTGIISWANTYEVNWPTDFDKKWIPFAPSAQDACRALKESRAYRHGENAWVLKVIIPVDTWQQWERDGLVVNNLGYLRDGDSHTDREGHLIYGRVKRDQADPVFQFDTYDHEWDQYAIPP